MLSGLEGPTTTTAAGFGALFTKSPGSWDCDTCLVQNKPQAVKCVACETAKPGTGTRTLSPLGSLRRRPLWGLGSCSVLLVKMRRHWLPLEAFPSLW
uniref:Nuclear pore complex protein Nup153 n=1 Tax=Hucho hucho TaxID=62062 RepID=A0A4W5KU89_9TELE